jgi:hypothetical protein
MEECLDVRLLTMMWRKLGGYIEVASPLFTADEQHDWKHKEDCEQYQQVCSYLIFFETIILCPLLVANFEYIANHVKTNILVLKEWSDFHFAPPTVNLAKSILLNTAHSNRPTRATLPKEV